MILQRFAAPVRVSQKLQNKKAWQVSYLLHKNPCARRNAFRRVANRHKQYLKQSHKVRYYNLLMSERLYDYLDGIECQAENLFEQTVKSLAEQEQATEKRKAKNNAVGAKDK